MANSRHEFQQRTVSVIRGIFEAHIAPGVKAGDAFEQAKRSAIESLEKELACAREIDFHRFNAGYMPAVNADTLFQPDSASTVTTGDQNG